jgi:hypothetical protein
MIRSAVVNGKTKGQVEVAVIEGPIPPHAELVAAHQSLNGLWIKGFSEKLQIALSLVSSIQLISKPPKRHIRDSEKVAKNETEALTQFTPVVCFKDRLWSRQKWSPRVIDKVEG